MYVIKNKRTGEYLLKSWYKTSSKLEKAKTFSTKGYSESSMTNNGMSKDDYEIVEVEIKLK